MSNNVQIANEIMRQIGKRALVMFGAKQVLAIENGLQFRIGKNDKGINVVQIILNQKDLYDMRFIRIRNMEVEEKGTQNNVSFEDLNKVIELHTGLASSL